MTDVNNMSCCPTDNGEPNEVVIAGFGLPGRAAADELSRRGIRFCVIELNPQTVERCGRAHVPIIAGDCADPQVLERAGIAHAKLLILVVPDDHAAVATTVHARRLNPGIQILTRCQFTSTGIEAKTSGADDVIIAEQVVAREVIERLDSLISAAHIDKTH